MRHFTSSGFWCCFDALPTDVQDLARRQYALLKQNPAHPSLRFKSVYGDASGASGLPGVALLIPAYFIDVEPGSSARLFGR